MAALPLPTSQMNELTTKLLALPACGKEATPRPLSPSVFYKAARSFSHDERRSKRPSHEERALAALREGTHYEGVRLERTRSATHVHLSDKLLSVPAKESPAPEDKEKRRSLHETLPASWKPAGSRAPQSTLAASMDMAFDEHRIKLHQQDTNDNRMEVSERSDCFANHTGAHQVVPITVQSS